MIRLSLPWPPKGLSCNGQHGHWVYKAKARSKYRRDAFAVAKAAGVPAIPGAILTITYCPPNRARRDAQNLPGMLKPAIDGIADAMGCDDNGFRVRFPDGFAEPVKGGAILVEITAP